MVKKHIAVIGTGYWGKNLVRNYHELGYLHTVCDNNPSTLKRLRNLYPDVKYKDNFDDVLKDPDIEAVVIASPAVLHYSFAKEALHSGRAVYVEKPLAVTLKEGEELVNLAHKKNLILMVGHLLQHHPIFIKLKEIVHKGDLGPIHYIYSNRLSLGKVRREENILWSFAPHDISMIISLCREEPSRVYATGGTFLQHRIADVTVTHMVFPSGIKSHIFVSWLHPFKEQKLVVVGRDRMAVFSDTEEWDSKLLLYSHYFTWENDLPVANKADPEQIVVEQSEPLKNECMHFLKCIDEHRRPITDGEEGLRVLRVLDQAQKYLESDS